MSPRCHGRDIVSLGGGTNSSSVWGAVWGQSEDTAHLFVVTAELGGPKGVPVPQCHPICSSPP